MLQRKSGIPRLDRKVERSKSFTMTKTPTESVVNSSKETHINTPIQPLKKRSNSFSTFDDKRLEEAQKGTADFKDILESLKKSLSSSSPSSSEAETEASEKLELSKKLAAENSQLSLSLRNLEEELAKLRSENSTLAKENQELTESIRSPRKPESYYDSPFPKSPKEYLEAHSLITTISSSGGEESDTSSPDSLEESDASSPDSLTYSVTPKKELKYGENVTPNNLTRNLYLEKLDYEEHIDGDLEAEKDQQIEVLPTEIEKLNILLHQARTEKLDDAESKAKNLEDRLLSLEVNLEEERERIKKLVEKEKNLESELEEIKDENRVVEAALNNLYTEKDKQIEDLYAKIDQLNALLEQARSGQFDGEVAENLRLLIEQAEKAEKAEKQVENSKHLLEELYDQKFDEPLETVVSQVIIDLEEEKEQRQKLLAENKSLEDELDITKKENGKLKNESKLFEAELEGYAKDLKHHDLILRNERVDNLRSFLQYDAQIDQLRHALKSAAIEKTKQESLLRKEKEKYEKLFKEGNEERSSYFAENAENEKSLGL